MAVPRVFISSTYYDLKQVRNNIGAFIKGLGYETVMHEKSEVAYSQNVPLGTIDKLLVHYHWIYYVIPVTAEHISANVYTIVFFIRYLNSLRINVVINRALNL